MNRPLHKKSSFFVKGGLFNKVNSFKDLEKRIEKLKAKNVVCPAYTHYSRWF
jgi:hypothetical protein